MVIFLKVASFFCESHAVDYDHNFTLSVYSYVYIIYCKVLWLYGKQQYTLYVDDVNHMCCFIVSLSTKPRSCSAENEGGMQKF